MRLSQERLEHMAWQDYYDFEDRMRAWTLAAEAELESEEMPRKIVFDLLFWANGEFHRRRRYLEQEKPETERHAGEVLRALSGKMIEMTEAKKPREQ